MERYGAVTATLAKKPILESLIADTVQTRRIGSTTWREKAA